MLRRPSSLSLRYVDVDPPTTNEFPALTYREICEYRHSILRCLATLKLRSVIDQRWHYKFTQFCFSPVLEQVVAPTPAPYSDVLKLDSFMRDFEIPSYMNINPGTTAGNGLCIVQLWTHMTREVGMSPAFFRPYSGDKRLTYISCSLPELAPTTLRTSDQRRSLVEP